MVLKSSLKQAIQQEKPLQMVGVINAYSALMAEACGFNGLYLSGAGVANASYGLPDIGITTCHDVVEDVRRITAVTSKPLLVDIDTGWGNAFNISRTIQEMIKAGAAGVHMEDQVQAKRCGHRPGKALVDGNEMCDRIKAAVDGRTDENFVIMARTDAFANEGLEAAIERCISYVEAGADMIFAEALQTLDAYRAFVDAVNVPVLANLTEFGKTPLFTLDELREVGIGIALYPLSAFRAMNQAALKVYETIRKEGTQKNVIETMQTREELYHYLNYYEYERALDKFEEEK